jgi:hypothetical protein
MAKYAMKLVWPSLRPVSACFSRGQILCRPAETAVKPRMAGKLQEKVMNTEPIIVEATYHVPIERVWDAITNKDSDAPVVL